MKLLLSFLIFALYFINVALGGCFSTKSDSESERRLGIETRWTAGSGADGWFYAKIYYGSSISDGQWSQWKKLDNAACDDYQEGAIDYFDDFYDITAPWLAISIYNCVDDDLTIQSVKYWNGYQEKTVLRFCENIGNQFKNCMTDEQDKYGTCYPGSTDLTYGAITIVQGGCEGITFRMDEKDAGGWAVGTAFVLDNPGTPSCSGSDVGNVNNDYYPYNPYNYLQTQFEEKLLNYLMFVIAIALLLFVSNSCLITVMIRRNTAGVGGIAKYEKVVNDIE